MIEITRIIMGMPITIAVADSVDQAVIDATFDLFVAVDEKFSTYRAESEISRFNKGELREEELSTDVHHVFALARQTEKESHGYFNMQKPDGRLDPSGIVKGWAIARAVAHLHEAGLKNFFIDAGGDVQSSGVSGDGTPWRVGIRSPFHLGEIIKVLEPAGAGVATSGSTIRGAHIWNPHAPQEKLDDVLSITVIGPNILEADRFATAAFAMGRKGVNFIEALPGFEAYQVDALGEATLTSGFRKFEVAVR